MVKRKFKPAAHAAYAMQGWRQMCSAYIANWKVSLGMQVEMQFDDKS